MVVGKKKSYKYVPYEMGEKWAKNIVSFGKIKSNWYNFPFVLLPTTMYIQIPKKISKKKKYF